MAHLKNRSRFGRLSLAKPWIDRLQWVWEMLLGKADSSFIMVEIFMLQLSHMENQHFQIKGFLWTAMKSDFSWSHCSVCKNRFYLSQCSEEQGLCPSSISGVKTEYGEVAADFHVIIGIIKYTVPNAYSPSARSTADKLISGLCCLHQEVKEQKFFDSSSPDTQFKGRAAGKGDVTRSGLMDQDKPESANVKHI